MSWFKRQRLMQDAIDRLEAAGFTVSRADPGTPALRGGTVRIEAEMFALLLETQSAAFAWAEDYGAAHEDMDCSAERLNRLHEEYAAIKSASAAFESFMDSKITQGGDTHVEAH